MHLAGLCPPPLHSSSDLHYLFLLFQLFRPLTTNILKVLPEMTRLDCIPPPSFLAFTCRPLESDPFNACCSSLAFTCWRLPRHCASLSSPKVSGASFSWQRPLSPVTLDFSVHLAVFITVPSFRILPTFVSVILHVLSSPLVFLSLPFSSFL